MKKIIIVLTIIFITLVLTGGFAKDLNTLSQIDNSIVTDSTEISELYKKLTISKRNNDWENQINFLKLLSKKNSDQGNIPEALKLALEAIQIADNYKIDQKKAGLNFRVSSLLEKIEAYNEAIVYRKRQAKWNKINNNSNDEYNSLSGIGLLYYNLKEYEHSKVYYQKALKLAGKISNQHFQAHSNNNIGLTYLRVNKKDKAIIHFQKAIILFKSNTRSSDLDSLMVGIVSGNLAECYFNKYEKDKAFSLLNTDITFCKKYESYSNLVSAYLKLVKLHMNFGSWVKAKSYNKLAQNVLNDYPNASLQLKTYKNFISLYMNSKEIDKAENYINKYIRLNDSLYGPKIIEKITATKSVFQLDKINYELLLNQALLDKKKEEISQLKQGEKILRLKIYLAIGVALMLLSLGFFGYLKIKSDQTKKAEIQKIKNQLIKAELKNKKVENIELKEDLDAKNEELTNYAIEISESYQFTQNIRHELKELKSIGKGNTQEYTKLLNQVNSQLGIENELKDFQRKANILHKNFNEKLIKEQSQLTKNDLYLCGLIRLNLSNKDIAILRNVTEKAIRMSKYRLKQKLLLPKEKDLGNFLKQL